jgi:hypothetical protein
MKKSFHLQDDLQKAYQNLLRRLPEPLRNDASTQKTILVYLKLGGTRLANHGIDIINKQFQIESLSRHDDAAHETDSSFDEDIDMTEPHPHEMGGFEFPIEEPD